MGTDEEKENGFREGCGCFLYILAIIGLILCFTGAGAVVGVPLIMISRMLKAAARVVSRGSRGEIFKMILGVLFSIAFIFVFIFIIELL